MIESHKDGQDNYIFRIFDANTGDMVLKLNNIGCSEKFGDQAITHMKKAGKGKKKKE